MPCVSPSTLWGKCRHTGLSHSGLVSRLELPKSQTVIAQCGGATRAVMNYAGSYICIAWQSIIERGFHPPLQPWDEAAYNASIILRAVVLGDRDCDTQPQFIAVSLGAKRKTIIGVIVAVASSVWQNASRVKGSGRKSVSPVE